MMKHTFPEVTPCRISEPSSFGRLRLRVVVSGAGSLFLLFFIKILLHLSSRILKQKFQLKPGQRTTPAVTKKPRLRAAPSPDSIMVLVCLAVG